ncbi:hypothetical protein NMD56_25960 (plasmid) [Escherichia coli]|uniref:hypothetical protein n=1 Tax=Escherichia coli TaxID=562 RepID=UPI00351CDD58
MSRSPPQRRKARARNGVALQSDGSFIAGTVKAAHPFTDAASVVLTLRQPGMETRCPKGAGPGQHCWPGAKHDSPGSRQGSRPQSWPVNPSDSTQI